MENDIRAPGVSRPTRASGVVEEAELTVIQDNVSLHSQLSNLSDSTTSEQVLCHAKSDADPAVFNDQETPSSSSTLTAEKLQLATAAHAHLPEIKEHMQAQYQSLFRDLAIALAPKKINTPLVRCPELFAMRDDGVHTFTCYQDLSITNEVRGTRWVRDGITRIVGTSEDETIPKRIVGVQLAPSITACPTIYSNDPSNIETAIRERLTKKKLPFSPSEMLTKQLKDMVWKSMHSKRKKDLIFDEESIVAWGEEFLWRLDELKSGKWSAERFASAVESLLRDSCPEFKAKFMIKAEPMPSNEAGGVKAPRLLIADGDVGTVMATIVIRCFEHLLFKKLESKSIKHQDKQTAVQRVAEALRVTPKGQSLEGDGSAWDTCCSEMLRELVENPVLVWIAHIICKRFIVPEQWVVAHQAFNEKTFLKGMWTRKEKSANIDFLNIMYVVIPSIRRSGHLGTSCLNFWVNYVCWHVIIYGSNAVDFLDPKCIKRTDRWKIDRVCKSAFEGDDSALTFWPEIIDKRGDIEEMWKSLGFNMKIIFRKAGEALTFAGMNILLDIQGPTSTFMPDLKRYIQNGAYTCSPQALKASQDSDVQGLRNIEAAKNLSRAREYAASMPRFARAHLDRAKMLSKGAFVLDHDNTVRITGSTTAEDMTFEDAYGVVSMLIACSEGDDMRTLRKFNLDCTEEVFSTYLLRYKHCDVINLPDHAEWCQVVPESWQ